METQVTKADIVEQVRSQTKVSTKDAAILVESLFEMIRKSLEQGNSVKLPGFGNFNIKKKSQRIGCNPKTGEAIPITARKVISFKPSHILRDRVNGRSVNT
jgi:integration host factor subunit alpha